MPIPVFRSIWLATAIAFAASIAQISGQASGQVSGQAPPSAQSGASSAADIDLLENQALEEGQAGKTEDALRDYRRALEQRPGWKEGLWNLGMLEYGSDRFAEAKDTFQKVVDFAPGLGIAWSLLGLSEFETADYDNALAHLETAQSLGIKDDDEIARVSSYHLGILCIRSGQFERASSLLLGTFGTGMASPQAKIALGLATLRVPLLPSQLDPSREALMQAAGEAAVAGAGQPARLAALVRDHPELPYLHYAYGLALADAGREQAAREQILEETRISPASPAVWIELSRLELRQGAATEALKAAQEAVRISPDNRDAHLALAQAWQSVGKGQQAAAEMAFVPAAAGSNPAPEQRMVLLYANDAAKAETAPEANRQRWNRAMAEYSAAQYPAAAIDLKAWLATAPESGTGWALLGLSEFALKDFDNALIHLDRGSRLGLSAGSESLSLAGYTFGILLVRAGRFEQAANVLASIGDASHPLVQKAEFAQGLVLLRRAELPGGVSPSDTELVTAAGSIESLLLESQYDQAFPQLKLLIQRYPATPFLHYAYGNALIALSQFDQAAAQMQAERSISPASELPCVRLASIALRQHDSATAIAWAQHTLQLAPNSVDAHYLLGRASLEAGDLTSAIRELEIAARLSPASPEVHFNLAKAYARAKMSEKAQQEREIFSRLNAMEQSRPAHQGSQVDLGPRDSEDGMKAPPADAPASPRLH
jgi:tetratricopeptide (TPR) repeat protein